MDQDLRRRPSRERAAASQVTAARQQNRGSYRAKLCTPTPPSLNVAKAADGDSMRDPDHRSAIVTPAINACVVQARAAGQRSLRQAPAPAACPDERFVRVVAPMTASSAAGGTLTSRLEVRVLTAAGPPATACAPAGSSPMGSRWHPSAIIWSLKATALPPRTSGLARCW
ncbi:MAG: hypothetical protein IPH44_24035 [Myxococcales bacterium]|nr:hypothetical protein [Myxococcales bacterium]